MSTYDDVISVENGECSEEESAKSMQALLNSGLAWRLQGSFGREAMRALESGFVMLGTKSTSDAYGNRVPSRGEVKEGTKGSRALVVEERGEEWAKMLETVE